MGLMTLTFDLLTLKLISKSQMGMTGNLHSDFWHVRPLSSRVIRYLRDGRTVRRTDRRTDTSNAYCPLPYGRRHNNALILCIGLVVKSQAAWKQRETVLPGPTWLPARTICWFVLRRRVGFGRIWRTMINAGNFGEALIVTAIRSSSIYVRFTHTHKQTHYE